jgi:putative membrane protein
VTVLVIVFIIKLIRHKRYGEHGNHHHGQNWPWNKSAIDILKERYAKGEIDKKDFDERKKDLE